MGHWTPALQKDFVDVLRSGPADHTPPDRFILFPFLECHSQMMQSVTLEVANRQQSMADWQTEETEEETHKYFHSMVWPVPTCRAVGDVG